jgi:hypothetical protein
MILERVGEINAAGEPLIRQPNSSLTFVASLVGGWHALPVQR